jgi:FHS family L-fucose permease-like MFS transporter
MATISGVSNDTSVNGGQNQNNYTFDLVALTTLFFMWGLITSLNDILIPHLKNVFDLNYTQAMLVQFCFFSAYFIVSVPAGILVRKLGYKRGIVVGLVIAALGCLLFLPAAEVRVYAIFLAGLFVLAAGVTVLQVSANPYVTILGKPETASSRLTMTQAFNSLGTTVAPFLGAFLILSVVTGDHSLLEGEALDQFKQEEADAVKLPYAILAGAFLLLAGIFAFLRLPVVQSADDANDKKSESAWGFSHLRFGAIGIFLYVGAEVAIGSFLVNFIGLPSIAGLEEVEAAPYIAYYWGGAMVGRFIGAVVMRYFAAGKILAFNSVAAVVCILIAIVSDGWLAMWAILAVGLCNSIMFPTIFSLGVNELGDSAQGSGILCLAIVGGAIIPLIQGVFADMAGVQISFILPALCYLYICFYGLKGSIVKKG